jgi:PAS domain-containing protein
VSRFYGFLVASAVLIGAVVLLSGVLVGRFAERRALAYAEAHTARIVQTQARQHLAVRDFELVDPGVGRTAFGRFLRELPGVVRLKVYDRTGRVVWSDEPRLIGQAFPENGPLARALAGEVVTVLGAPERAEHTYERAQAYVAEVYVPITLSGELATVGVIEAYEDATPLVLDIRRTKRVLWVVAGAIGALLYGALALIVWTASRNERRAFRRLEGQNREIRDAHEWLAAILAAVSDRMIILDRTMRIVWLNPAARQAYGAVKPVGRACYEVLGGEPDACQACPAARTLSSARV